MALFAEFLLRLVFGLAAGMLIVVIFSPRQVTSGYFRNNLYVTLGLSALASLLSRSAAPEAFWYAVVAAVVSYLGSVCWLYERPDLGKWALAVILLTSFEAALIVPSGNADADDVVFSEAYASIGERSDVPAADAEMALDGAMRTLIVAGALRMFGDVSSGLLLGVTMAAMLLGHWYLNSPTMQLQPLRRLIVAMGVAVVLQMAVSACGLWGEIAYAHSINTQWALFVVLRWAFGLVGVAILAWMAWQTLKIPNTQSATGILYVAVIGTFVGETMSLLLSAESVFPV